MLRKPSTATARALQDYRTGEPGARSATALDLHLSAVPTPYARPTLEIYVTASRVAHDRSAAADGDSSACAAVAADTAAHDDRATDARSSRLEVSPEDVHEAAICGDTRAALHEDLPGSSRDRCPSAQKSCRAPDTAVCSTTCKRGGASIASASPITASDD